MKVGDIYPTAYDGAVEILSVSGIYASVMFLNTGNIRDVVKCNLLIKKVSDKAHRQELAETFAKEKEAAKVESIRIAREKRLAASLEQKRLADLKRTLKAEKDSDKAQAVIQREKERIVQREARLKTKKSTAKQARAETKFQENEVAKAKVKEVGKYSKVVINDFIEDGQYAKGVRVDDKQFYTRSYAVWAGIIQRCRVGGSFQNKFSHYEGTTVCGEWLENFQNFAKWYTSQPGYNHGWDVDKDMLSDGKHYSPETCTLLPRCVNLLFALRCVGLGLIDATKLDGIPRWRHKDKTFFTDYAEATAYVMKARQKHIDSLRDVYVKLGLSDSVFDRLEQHLIGSYAKG